VGVVCQDERLLIYEISTLLIFEEIRRIQGLSRIIPSTNEVRAISQQKYPLKGS